MRRYKMIAYRRQRVAEMLCEAATQNTIANTLGCAQSTVSKDIEYLEHDAREQMRQMIQKKLPLAHLSAIQGINKVINLAWKTANETKSETVRLSCLGLITESYRVRTNFMTEAQTIKEVTEWISKTQEDILKTSVETKIELAEIKNKEEKATQTPSSEEQEQEQKEE